uniref:Uncharacterized protein n=1 Tax=Ostreococcus mediterraneus TaxID=1486918 RepID=A0A7S0PJH1_9CHLO|mmetsp:Transcript_2861/g.10350  ORF Transcript_2861/g.10350 Transcript_2861/m.10350 type:complete len:117 (+) Transcript_2861:564-914(+)
MGTYDIKMMKFNTETLIFAHQVARNSGYISDKAWERRVFSHKSEYNCTHWWNPYDFRGRRVLHMPYQSHHDTWNKAFEYKRAFWLNVCSATNLHHLNEVSYFSNLKAAQVARDSYA